MLVCFLPDVSSNGHKATELFQHAALPHRCIDHSLWCSSTNYLTQLHFAFGHVLVTLFAKAADRRPKGFFQMH